MKKIKVFLAVLFCKCVRFAAKLLGRGSSLPGALTLKLFPGILGDITLPEKIIAVTGSNGKTSTVEMIAHVLISSGKKVAYNKEGSNQIEGVTTFLLNDCTLGGKVKSEIVLMESDERFARHTFKFFKPNYFIVTNLYRDQLTRNGHPEWVYNVIKEAVTEDMTLILNADDPLVSLFGHNRENVMYFGANELSFSEKENNSVYNDGKYCPVCKAPLEYEYYHYNHIGAYNCTSCGYKKPQTKWSLTAADLEKGEITINNEYTVALSFNGIYHCYNTLVALAVAEIAGIPLNDAAKVLSNYNLHSGRITDFTVGENKGTLLTSKHENSVSYDQSIKVAANHKGECTVLVIVDAVSRKYFTSETSWLWDIDFELLNKENVKEVVLAGRYCNDLASRFSFTPIPQDKIKVFRSINDAADHLKNNNTGYIYAITCFSDKGKFMALTEAVQ